MPTAANDLRRRNPACPRGGRDTGVPGALTLIGAPLIGHMEHSVFFVSGGAEHQGLDDDGLIAVIAHSALGV